MLGPFYTAGGGKGQEKNGKIGRGEKENERKTWRKILKNW
jgi:hypothetical protein